MILEVPLMSIILRLLIHHMKQLHAMKLIIQIVLDIRNQLFVAESKSIDIFQDGNDGGNLDEANLLENKCHRKY